MKWKKATALMMVCVLCVGGGGAWAEEAINAILTAGTTQAFTADAVPDEDLNAILEAGLSASSAINQQPWYFAVVTDQAVMEEINSSVSSGGAPAEGAEASEGAELPEDAAVLSEGAELPEDAELPEGAELPEDAAELPEGEAPEGATEASASAKAALGDSPVAVIIYMDENTASPNASFDCGLACQNMVIAANALGYGTKIVSSPTMALNGENHDALCETLGVDTSLTAVAVLLIGTPDAEVDGATGASERSAIEEKVSFVG